MHSDDRAWLRPRRMSGLVRRMRALVEPVLISAAGVMPLSLLLTSAACAAEAAATVGPASDAVMMWGFITAAASTGITALGAAYAVSHIGAAALGAMGERPELAGRALIFLGLAEGIAIYGLIISIMILARIG